MVLLIDEEPQREIVRTLRVDDVRLALGSLCLADVCERQWICGKGCSEHPQGEACEVLLDGRHTSLTRSLLNGRIRSGRTGASRRGRRGCWRRILQELFAVEARRVRPAFLSGHFVLPQILIRELDEDLELDWNEVVATDLPCAAGCGERLHGRELRVAAERLSRRGENGCGVFRLRDRSNRGLRRSKRRRAGKSHCGCEPSRDRTVSENAHVLRLLLRNSGRPPLDVFLFESVGHRPGRNLFGRFQLSG